MDKGKIFRDLHASTFVMPNPWDVGTTKLLASFGFKALATTSAGFAFSRGLPDGAVTFEAMIHHCRELTAATSLPVSADLEKGFGDGPEATARAIQLAAGVGLVGGSIEDAAGHKNAAIYPLTQAAERVAAAAQAARALPFPFTLTARAENFLHGVTDLDDTIRRLQAYERAGADVLFAPALPSLDAVRTVCQSVSKPVNFMVAIRGKSFTVRELADAGVRRISLATSLYRAAMTGLADAAREIRQDGTFGYIDSSMSSADFARFLAE
jgi:2-methylisocitrate lyase-like PEP mutase family enzyme